jgi:uncharacterized protein (DUF58 family)
MAPQTTPLSVPRAHELRRVQLRSRRMVTGGLLGQYRSAFRGTGLIYSDIREYQPGDDVKHIHWKATARTGTVYVKSYEEDRQLHVLLAVDISASLRAPIHQASHSKALEFCSLVSTLTQRGNDLLGACLFAKEVVAFLPPKSGMTRHHQILTALSANRESPKATDLRPAISHMLATLRRPAIIFLVSDFFCPPFDRDLRALAHRHDVVLVQIDHSPSALPSVGLASFVDAETGENVLVDTGNARVRVAFEKVLLSRQSALTAVARECGVDLIRITDTALHPLATLMRERANRSSR